jgi:catechol 2,3-dioxygenase-like lactoylglutathione lyase family enzyme
MERLISNLLAQFESGKLSRRQLVKTLAVASASASGLNAAPEGRGFKAASVNHLSFSVPDYAKTRDFYAELMGMTVKRDDGKGEATLTFGDSSLVVRKTRRADNAAYIDHVCYTISDWDRTAVESELKRRGLNPRPGQNEFSFEVKDPDGYGLQIAAKPHCCLA